MEAKEIPCSVCGAKSGENCNDGAAMLFKPHDARALIAAKMPGFAALDATDKALITYYAYVMLADSVSANSVAMFGKQLTSLEVQTFFAKKAIEELKTDKLLK